MRCQLINQRRSRTHLICGSAKTNFVHITRCIFFSARTALRRSCTKITSTELVLMNWYKQKKIKPISQNWYQTNVIQYHQKLRKRVKKRDTGALGDSQRNLTFAANIQNPPSQHSVKDCAVDHLLSITENLCSCSLTHPITVTQQHEKPLWYSGQNLSPTRSQPCLKRSIWKL